MAKIASKVSTQVAEKYAVDRTAQSFVLTAKDNPKDKVEVEIGDSKDDTKFQPQFKVIRWDNEVNLSVRLKDDTTDTESVSTTADKIVWSKGKIEAHFYDLPVDKNNPEGAYEFEVILKEKPTTNKVEFTLNTKGLDFFYQPELTQEEKDHGDLRPEKVVGSYAVYHKTKGEMNNVSGMEYKTGKVGHIFRPKIIDANGNEIWGKLNIDKQKGELSVTIDQTWLDKAVYPVIVDPTFGYTSCGASKTVTENFPLLMAYTAPENGNVTSLTMWRDSDHTAARNVKGAIYAYVSNTEAGALLAQTEQKSVSINPINTPQEITFNINNPGTSYSVTGSTIYFLGSWNSAASGSGGLMYDTVASNYSVQGNQTYGAWEDPFVADASPASYNNRKHSIYATYTPNTSVKDLIMSGLIVFPR